MIRLVHQIFFSCFEKILIKVDSANKSKTLGFILIETTGTKKTNLKRMNYRNHCRLISYSLILHLHLRTLHFHKLIGFHSHLMFFIAFISNLIIVFLPFPFQRMNVDSLLFILFVTELGHHSFRSFETAHDGFLGFGMHYNLAEWRYLFNRQNHLFKFLLF